LGLRQINGKLLINNISKENVGLLIPLISVVVLAAVEGVLI
jgi:hypothetical protein